MKYQVAVWSRSTFRSLKEKELGLRVGFLIITVFIQQEVKLKHT